MTGKGTNPTHVTRREFLKTAAVTGAAGVLAGCGASSKPTPSPTAAASPTVRATAAASATPSLVPTLALRRPELLKMYPDVKSRVVHAQHAAAWQENRLNLDAIRAMLDASMAQLTGVGSAREAWAGLFSPDEKIAIKVNAFMFSQIFTHTILVKVVTDSLINAGIPAEQIFIYDFTSRELTRAGFTQNENQPGVRCFGSDYECRSGYSVNGIDVGLSPVLLDCNALINMPVLKSHMISGLTFAMKNHFGTVDNPEKLHNPFDENIAALNALPEIKDRTRLIVGDILQACLRHKGTPPYWQADYNGNSILVSHDPVATDTIGLKILSQLLIDTDGDPEWNVKLASTYLAQGAKVGVGTNDPDQIELVEISL